jgi:hypothetical protein
VLEQADFLQPPLQKVFGGACFCELHIRSGLEKQGHGKPGGLSCISLGVDDPVGVER